MAPHINGVSGSGTSRVEPGVRGSVGRPAGTQSQQVVPGFQRGPTNSAKLNQVIRPVSPNIAGVFAPRTPADRAAQTCLIFARAMPRDDNRGPAVTGTGEAIRALLT